MTKALLSPAILRSPELLQRLTEVVADSTADSPAEILSAALEYLAGIHEGTSAVPTLLSRMLGYEGGPDKDEATARASYASRVIVGIARRAAVNGFTADWSEFDHYAKPGIVLTDDQGVIGLTESLFGTQVDATILVNGAEITLPVVAREDGDQADLLVGADEAWRAIWKEYRTAAK